MNKYFTLQHLYNHIISHWLEVYWRKGDRVYLKDYKTNKNKHVVEVGFNILWENYEN